MRARQIERRIYMDVHIYMYMYEQAIIIVEGMEVKLQIMGSSSH